MDRVMDRAVRRLPRAEVQRRDTPEDYDHPIYYSHPNDPLYTLRCVEDWGTCEIEGMEVRIPRLAKAVEGSDGHMTVIDLKSGGARLLASP